MPDVSVPGAAGLVPAAAPHNIEAEQSVLGAVLSDNEVYHRVSDFLRAEHFYDPVHGRLFAAIAALIQQGQLADAITLAPFAQSDEGFKPIGGAGYLVELVAGAAYSAAARDHARLIHDLALRRALIAVGGEIVVDAREDVERNAAQIVETSERKLFDLVGPQAGARGFVTFGDALALSIEMANAAHKREGGLSGLSTGLTKLDELMGGLHRSDLVIIAGRPSMGKTALATNIAFHVARRFQRERDEDGVERTVDGGVVGFFSLEMSSEQLATRLLAEYSGISSNSIRQGRIDAQQFGRLVDASQELARAPLHIDDTGGLSISAIANRARRLKRTHGLDLLVVDYLQLIMPPGGKSSDNRVQDVTLVTQGLKALAKDLDVPVLALSQLSRKVEDREEKRPQLSDLRESGSIEQDADVVMFVYRDSYYAEREEPKTKKDSADEKDRKAYQKWEERQRSADGKAEIIIGKQRHGPIGTVEVAFDATITKFSNLEEGGKYLDPPRRGAPPVRGL